MTPKRVVFIGATWPENERYCPHFLGVRAGLKKLGIPYRFVTCRPALNVDEVVEFEPDLVIYGLMDMVKNHEWRREIRERLPNAAIVMWYGDYRDDRMVQPTADCSEMDGMFVSNGDPEQKRRYKKIWRMKDVQFLPLGCEPAPERVIDQRFQGSKYDFIFIGGSIPNGAFHERASFIGKLKSDHGLTIINSPDAQVRSRIYRAMPAIYSTSRVALDVSHFTDIPMYTSIRYWEIPAYYGFALTKRFPGCEQFYPSSMRVYFNTIEEAVELKDYWLKHDRTKMVDAAHEHSYNHTYDGRFKKMFSMI